MGSLTTTRQKFNHHHRNPVITDPWLQSGTMAAMTTGPDHRLQSGTATETATSCTSRQKSGIPAATGSLTTTR
jgi:hypothetical protein